MIQIWRRSVIGVLAVALLILATLALQIYAYSFQSSPYPTEVAIVLGAAVWDGQPSPVFRERINHAITLHRNGQVEQIIFTGGIGQDDQLAESEVARLYALKKGISKKQIAIETRSQTTLENLIFARQIMREKDWETALIVSDPLHMRRAMIMAKDLQIDAYPSPTPTTRFRSWKTQLGFLRREIYFYGLYLVERPFAEVEPLITE